MLGPGDLSPTTPQTWRAPCARSVMRLGRRLRQMRDESVDLSANQLSVMSVLLERGAQLMGELAAAEKVRPPVDDPDRQRLWRSAAWSPAAPTRRDGRQCLVTLTAAGRACSGQPATPRRVAGRPDRRARAGRARGAAAGRPDPGQGEPRVTWNRTPHRPQRPRSPRRRSRGGMFAALRRPQLPDLPRRLLRLQHRHLDAAGGPGLAGARAVRRLRRRRRHHHRRCSSCRCCCCPRTAA